MATYTSDDSSNESSRPSSGGIPSHRIPLESEELIGTADLPKRKRPGMSARERNLRRLESNERERLRMHGLNAAFEVPLF